MGPARILELRCAILQARTWPRCSPLDEDEDLSVTKEELRKQLQEQFERHLQANPEAVTLYAAEPEPEKRPWKKKPSLLDQAFAQSLADIENG